ncbi:hypothetical protein, partial [Klebsiella pneumoniae]|uniref:hypothetical protein n=1 Tax=Klebsiella pneumoniae TaxID=573 RepID=UPI00406AB282
QTETEATGAPQKHHYTLNQQVGSITAELLYLHYDIGPNQEPIPVFSVIVTLDLGLHGAFLPLRLNGKCSLIENSTI